jgi:hypothetical protein
MPSFLPLRSVIDLIGEPCLLTKVASAICEASTISIGAP